MAARPYSAAPLADTQLASLPWTILPTTGAMVLEPTGIPSGFPSGSPTSVTPPRK